MPRITEWILGIIGGIAGFMGAFILLASPDQWVGIGGDLTWMVGDIAPAWGYGMLFGGVALLAVAGSLFLWERGHPHEYAQTSERTGLITHSIVFLLVNGFLWFQDIAAGGGLEYAYWATVPWGIGLISHAIAYVSSRRHPSSLHPA